MKLSFRALDGTIQNRMLSHIMDDVRISSALINCFFKIPLSDINDGLEIATLMKAKVETKNELEKYLKKKCINKTFQPICLNDLNDFPKVDIELIKSRITFGWYQIEQGFGYLAEHHDKNGDIQIRLDTNCNKKKGTAKVIGAIFYSRHCNHEKYEVFIKYKPNDDNVESILAWICSCLSGHRTCGTCSHVAAMIYYLSFGKYQKELLKKPGSTLNSIFHNTSAKDTEDEEDQEGEELDGKYIVENDDMDTIEAEKISDEIVNLNPTITNAKMKRTISVMEKLVFHK